MRVMRKVEGGSDGRRKAVVTAPKFYHGGVAGLPVGDFILPACELEPNHWHEDDSQPLAFVTTDLLYARQAALDCEDHNGAAMVYRVQPIGQLWPDQCQSGATFGCRKPGSSPAAPCPRGVRAARKADQNVVTW